MRKSYFLLFIVLIIFVNESLGNKIPSKFKPAECPLQLPEELINSTLFKFGFMEVPELSESENGKTIELAVAVFKCRTDNPTHKPLVLCAGGPGSSNIDEFVPALAGGLGNLFLNNRDVVIIESRGLKYSKPNLIFKGLEELQLSMLSKNYSADETIEMYLDTLQSIHTRYSNNGVNLAAFNSFEISNEIAYVMEHLGYEKFSVFGTSYGTMVAQYLLLYHANRLESVVMNGTMDINRGGYDMHTNLIIALDAMFAECERVPELAAAYPNIKTRFLELVKNLNEEPDTITAKYHGDGNEYSIVLNGNRIAVWLFHQMYNNTQLPLTIHKLINRDYSEMVGYPGMILPIPEFSMGMSLSVFLSETPDIKTENLPLNSEYADLVKGSALSVFTPYFWNKAKSIWKVEGVNHNKTVKTDVPVLLLAGQMDYLCLPSYAKQFAENNKNAHLFLFEGVAHSPVDQGDCAIMMLKQFFDDPNKAPDSSCMAPFKHEYVLPE